MRRDLWLIGAIITLIGAVLGGFGALLLTPALPPDLLPPGAQVLQVDRRGPGRLEATIVLPDNERAQVLHQRFTGAGWRQRRVNVLPDEFDRTYIRRSLDGYLFESALIRPDLRDRQVFVIAYQRCVRRISCSWR